MPKDTTLTFEGLFRSLVEAYHPRAVDKETLNVYRSTLSIFPLSVLVQAAQTLRQTRHRFPTTGDWAIEAARLQQRQYRTATRADVPQLSREETQVWRRAEFLHWEDTPCGCLLCVAANVTEKLLRFVPEVEGEDERDRHVQLTDSGRIVTAGHWAHGDELACWYRARARFWATYRRVAAGPHPPPRLPNVLREPGQEG